MEYLIKTDLLTISSGKLNVRAETAKEYQEDAMVAFGSCEQVGDE
jgi:hypothetical protein